METPVSHSSSGKATPKKSGTWLIIVIVLVVLLAAGLIIFRKQVVPQLKAVIASIFGKKEVPALVIPVADTTSVTDSMAFTEPLPPPTIGKRHYIIVGSFEVEANADKYVNKLQQMGFEATKIPREKKNMWAVGCISFDTQKEALDQLNHYRNKIHHQAWVLGY